MHSPAPLTQPPLALSSNLVVNLRLLQASNSVSTQSMSCGRRMSITSIKVRFVKMALKLVVKMDF